MLVLCILLTVVIVVIMAVVMAHINGTPRRNLKDMLRICPADICLSAAYFLKSLFGDFTDDISREAYTVLTWLVGLFLVSFSWWALENATLIKVFVGGIVATVVLYFLLDVIYPAILEEIRFWSCVIKNKKL
jgi:cobalamin biosynthesis protein CobD/CbiB